MRRLGILLLLIAAFLTASPSVPRGQRRATTISDDVNAAIGRGAPVRVIVQGDESALTDLGGRLRGGLRRRLADAVVAELTSHDLRALIAEGRAAHISVDLPVVSGMAITNRVTRADDVWEGINTGLLQIGDSNGSIGRGVGVAVIDSGIASHAAFDGRVVARVNFVSSEPGVSGDPFGHGTHVAGSIGGSVSAASRVTRAYAGGSAPGVHFVDVRVLASNGVGYTSDVIAGIDWAVANRARYGIRIINLSLGHPVAEPSATDPLCRAVARAVHAGVVVVASSGNYGRTAAGEPVLGGVTSPGNSPFAITVGSLDLKGTVDTSDDRVAPYSSRGPTKYDFAVKPDIAAPGSALVSTESDRSYISRTYPQFHVAGRGNNGYQRLSGTSMAAGVVSGGVALMIAANPTLTPAQVKFALQLGARFDHDAGLIGAGAGHVNFASAQAIASSGGVLVTTLTNTLTDYGGPAYRDAGGPDGLIDRIYDRTGIRLLSLLSSLLSIADQAEWSVLHLLGLRNPIASAAPNYVVWGNVAGWSSSYYVVWGNTIQSPSGQYVVWGNSNVYSEYVVWSNGFVGEGQH